MVNNAPCLNIDPTSANPTILAEIVDSIEIIPLETNDSSLIKNCSKLVYKNNIYYVLSAAEVLAFDAQGNSLFTTRARFGLGPEDYYTLTDFNISDNKNIDLFDAMRSKIKTYDNQNNFISALSLPKEILPANHYLQLKDDLYLFLSGTGSNIDLKFYSKQKNEIIKNIHTERPFSFTRTVPLCLETYNGNHYFSYPYPNNELYTIDVEQADIKQILQLDFGKYNFSIDELTTEESPRYYYDFMRNNIDKYVYPLSKYSLPNDYLIYFSFKNKSHIALTNKQTNETKVYYNEPNSKQQFPMPTLIQDKALYYVCEPLYLPYYIDQKLMSNNNIDKLKSIEETDNPIIIKYKLKS